MYAVYTQVHVNSIAFIHIINVTDCISGNIPFWFNETDDFATNKRMVMSKLYTKRISNKPVGSF